jgi:hypothetical protein
MLALRRCIPFFFIEQILPSKLQSVAICRLAVVPADDVVTKLEVCRAFGISKVLCCRSATRLDPGRGSYCLGNIAGALRSEDETEQQSMAGSIQSAPLTFYGGGDGMAPRFDFVMGPARCFAPEEGWTRHPQIGNCGAPDGASMFTQVNFHCVNKLGESLYERGIER